MTPVLDVRGLTVDLGSSPLLRDVSFSVAAGTTLGLVGESGSGKSLTSLAVMGLLPDGMRATSGQVLLHRDDLLTLGRRELQDRRGTALSMVFQEPMTALNPAFTAGDQIGETLRRHMGLDRRSARRRARELLTLVGIPASERALDWYPYEFSGGMRQRVMIAMAIACEPELLIADEPTTALDTTVQAQVLDLLQTLRDELDMAMVFITHDMAVIAEVADTVAVMYSGEIVEHGTARRVLHDPQHPYTRALIAALPHHADPEAPLPTIAGGPPSPDAVMQGCRFAPRCPIATTECSHEPIVLDQIEDGSLVRCIHIRSRVPT